jgi:hypothetical protein
VTDGGVAWLTQEPAARIRVSDEILERFPSFRLLVLYAFGIRNSKAPSAAAACRHAPGPPETTMEQVSPEDAQRQTSEPARWPSSIYGQSKKPWSSTWSY